MTDWGAIGVGVTVALAAIGNAMRMDRSVERLAGKMDTVMSNQAHHETEDQRRFEEIGSRIERLEASKFERRKVTAGGE